MYAYVIFEMNVKYTLLQLVCFVCVNSDTVLNESKWKEIKCGAATDVVTHLQRMRTQMS